jgi:hypothetical protein
LSGLSASEEEVPNPGILATELISKRRQNKRPARIAVLKGHLEITWQQILNNTANLPPCEGFECKLTNYSQTAKLPPGIELLGRIVRLDVVLTGENIHCVCVLGLGVAGEDVILLRSDLARVSPSAGALGAASTWKVIARCTDSDVFDFNWLSKQIFKIVNEFMTELAESD